MTNIKGSGGDDRGLRLVALLHASADADVVSVRQAGVQRRHLRRERLHDGCGLRARREVGLHGDGRQSVPAPDDRIFLAVLDRGDLAQGNGFPVRQRHLKRPDGRQRRALLGGGPDEHVVEPDPAAHLGRRDARDDRVDRQSQLLRAEAEESGLILVDPDPDGAGGPDPVVVDVRGAGGRAEKLGHLGGDLAHLFRLPPADPVLERPADRRAELQRVDPPDSVREIGRQRLLELRLHAFALLESLGDDDGLGEKVVRQLHVQGQVEPDGALPDIGAPMIDVLIVLQELVQTGRGLLGRVDGRVFGQLQVDQQLGPVGRREELLRNEAHAKERHREQDERRSDRDPAGLASPARGRCGRRA